MFNQIKDASLSAVSAVLAFFYDLPVVGGSYGLAIILLTCTVMIVLMPLTLKATRSTIAMTQLQPELKALQKKYKDDKQQLQQEMMGLYSKHGVNPVGGCLPMLAQLPVFLILFNVLRGLTRRVSERPYYSLATRAQELAGASDAGVGANTFDPQYLSHDSTLYQDLSTHTEMGFGPFDLSAQAGEVVTSGSFSAVAYVLLILFVVGSSYYQQRQITSRRGSMPDNPTPQQQTQQQLMRILPLMSGIWSFFFPAGLVLYWATSNVFRIGQQAYITRTFYSEDGDGTKAMAAVNSGDDDDTDDGSPSTATGSKGSKGGTSAKADEPALTDDDLIGDGRPGRSRSRDRDRGRAENGAGDASATPASNGVEGGSNGSTPADRQAAWDQMRSRRQAKTKSRPSGDGGGSGGRITPKGTKPTSSKKKRKR